MHFRQQHFSDACLFKEHQHKRQFFLQSNFTKKTEINVQLFTPEKCPSTYITHI